jgi:hypothetical protein
MSFDSATVSISNGSIQISAPNGGEVFHSGDVAEIKWQTSPGLKTVSLYYSRKGREKWKLIAQRLDAGTGVANWTVPVVTKTYPKGFVKVVGLDELGHKVSSDTSDAPFTIAP